ncbi:MAG TPA: DinB family protein [Bryobacteraceae bacterium]|nr:DinB family protein [Bryobacteraceae bacterium]
MIRSCILILAAANAASFVCAQENPQTAPLKQAYESIKNNFTKAAEQMAEDNYSFKPTPELQNFGQRVAHIADSNARTCGAIKGERKSVGAAEKTSKADLVSALKESFDYCDSVFNSLTDADAAKMVQMGRGGARPELSTLWGLVVHDNEVYGTMTVYMRLKGVVPPSTAERAGRMGRGRRE